MRTDSPSHTSSRIAARGWTLVVRLFQWLGQRELIVLVALLVFFGSVFAFVQLTDEVLEGETQSIDEAILLALRSPNDVTDPIGPLWVEEAMRDMTALGGGAVLVLLSLSISIYLVLQRRLGAVTFLVASVVGGAVISLILKEIFGRPRPDLVTHLSYVTTSSFPSGHSTQAAVTYLTLGALLARIHDSRRMKAFFLVVATFLTVMVGISRVYLGVHWPTDVLGGWTVGAAWAILCWFTVRWLQARGRIEKSQ